MKWNACLFFTLLLIPIDALGGSAADDYPADLSKWLVRRPPDDEERGRAANHDTEHEWIVFLTGDRPSVRLRAVKRDKSSPYPSRQESYPPMPFKVPQGTAKEGLRGEWCSLEVPDGWLIGFNAGEFGGALWWFSPDGTKRYKISKDRVIGFFKTDAGILALEGIAHLSISRGRIVRLNRGKDGQWTADAFADLKGAPQTAVVGTDGTMTVATTDRLLRVDLKTRKIDVLLKDAFWGGLYPKSMIVAPSGSIYLGMRHGVAQVEKRGGAYEATWLIPDVTFD
jgi:hypothetical protein